MPGEGECVATELFYMRVGTLRLRRRWIDPDAVLRGQIFLTAFSAVMLLMCGFVLGSLASGAWKGAWVGSLAVSHANGRGDRLESHSVMPASPASWLGGFPFGGCGGCGGCRRECRPVHGLDLDTLKSLGNSSLY